MVTVEEAQQSIAETRSEIEAQRAENILTQQTIAQREAEIAQARADMELARQQFEASKAQQQAQETRVRLTREQIQRQTLAGRQQVRDIKRQREIEKQKRLRTLKTQRETFETSVGETELEFKGFESNIFDVEKSLSEFETEAANVEIELQKAEKEIEDYKKAKREAEIEYEKQVKAYEKAKRKAERDYERDLEAAYERDRVLQQKGEVSGVIPGWVSPYSKEYDPAIHGPGGGKLAKELAGKYGYSTASEARIEGTYARAMAEAEAKLKRFDISDVGVGIDIAGAGDISKITTIKPELSLYEKIDVKLGGLLPWGTPRTITPKKVLEFIKGEQPEKPDWENVPSAKDYQNAVKDYNDKWNKFATDGVFTGTNDQFTQYKKDFDKLKTLEATYAKDSKFEYASKKYLPKYVEHVPIILKDFTKSLGKGGVKTGLYFVDTGTDISNTIFKTPEYGIFTDTYAEKLKDWSDYDFDKMMYADPDVQNLFLTAALAGAGSGALGARAAMAGKYAYRGLVAYQGYNTIKNPSDKNIAALGTMIILPKLLEKGMNSLRVRQGYSKAVKDLEKTYGKNSAQVIEFKAAWNRAFSSPSKGGLKRSEIPTKQWTSKDVSSIKGRTDIIKIVDDTLRKYDPTVIGSTTITTQTSLKTPPRGRGKLGDIDVQSVRNTIPFKINSQSMANDVYLQLLRKGYNVKFSTSKFQGTTKYHVTLDGKELLNVGTDNTYFLSTQAGPLLNWYEPTNINAWTKDPTGVRLGNIRDQMRVKLWKGFVEKTRPKDVIDALGIKEGTDYLFAGQDTSVRTSFNDAALNKLFSENVGTAGYYSLGNQPAYYSSIGYSDATGTSINYLGASKEGTVQYTPPTEKPIPEMYDKTKYTEPDFFGKVAYIEPAKKVEPYVEPTAPYIEPILTYKPVTPTKLAPYIEPIKPAPTYKPTDKPLPYFKPVEPYKPAPYGEAIPLIIPTVIPTEPPIKPPFITGDEKEKVIKRKKRIIRKEQGWDVYVKPIKKGKKFIKANKVSLKRSHAEDLGSYIQDTSLGRTFKLKKSTKLPKQPRLITPPNYFDRIGKRKFRESIIRRGKEIKTPDRFIEKGRKGQNFLLDTIEERKKIKVLARLAQLRKRSRKSIMPKIKKIRRKAPKSIFKIPKQTKKRRKKKKTNKIPFF